MKPFKQRLFDACKDLPRRKERKLVPFKELSVVIHEGIIHVWKHRRAGTGIHGEEVARLTGIIVIDDEREL